MNTTEPEYITIIRGLGNTDCAYFCAHFANHPKGLKTKEGSEEISTLKSLFEAPIIDIQNFNGDLSGPANYTAVGLKLRKNYLLENGGKTV